MPQLAWPRYTWDGPEQELDFCVVVSNLVIEEVEDRPDDLERRAMGVLTWKDYVEGGIFTDNWTARKLWGRRVSSNWVVMCDAWPSEYSFCLTPSVDKKIKWFVAQKLERAEEMCPKSATDIVEGPVRFGGDRVRYSGECVCAALHDPKASPSFDWQRATGGNFPQNCFECSCGQRWWCYNPEQRLWAPVADPAAWEMFCEYNGVARYQVAALDKGFHLLQTLRNQGMIPIG